MDPLIIERAAYRATHLILATDLGTPLACPGARRSHTVDTIAQIIRDTYQDLNLNQDQKPGKEKDHNLHHAHAQPLSYTGI